MILCHAKFARTPVFCQQRNCNRKIGLNSQNWSIMCNKQTIPLNQLDKEKSVENNEKLLDQYFTLNPINALSSQVFSREIKYET